jgi:predicted membrane protein
MTFLDVFSLLILLFLILLGVGLVLLLAYTPGAVARSRHSPWAEAINIAGWVGILVFPIWIVALAAAFIRPRTGEGAAIAISESESAELAATISLISERLKNLENWLRAVLPKAGSSGPGGPQPC